MSNKCAVILLSGGIDSTTTLAIAKNEGFDIYALSFNYSQRHNIELEAARRSAEYFDVRKHLIINFDLREIGGSALTADMEVPKEGVRGQGLGISNKNQSQSPNPQLHIPVTYVPARNTIFLAFALAWAEVLSADDIFIGATAVDYSGYPDCRPEFLRAFEDMANLATKASVEGKARFKIHAPLIDLTKGEIIKKGIELGIDYSMTWSCYDPQPAKEGVRGQGSGVSSIDQSPIPNPQSIILYSSCGRCDSCLLRAKGFKEAGVRDPFLGLKKHVDFMDYHKQYRASR